VHTICMCCNTLRRDISWYCIVFLNNIHIGIRGAVGVAAATGPLKSAVQDTISALVVFGIGVTKDILPL
jgi:hypothetical protein